MQNTELVTYIQTELQKGVLPETIREVLVQTGWQTGDIDAAFASVQGEDTKKTSRNWNKIWGWGIPIVFISTSLLAYIFYIIGGIYEAGYITFAWFPTVGFGLLVVLGYFVMAIVRRKMSYVKEAFLMLLIFSIVGYGTCLLNMMTIQ